MTIKISNNNIKIHFIIYLLNKYDKIYRSLPLKLILKMETNSHFISCF